MSYINKNDYFVLTNQSFGTYYYSDDVFIVIDIISEKYLYKDIIFCKSLFRNESFNFVRTQFLRKITPSAAKKRIEKQIKKLMKDVDFLKTSLDEFNE